MTLCDECAIWVNKRKVLKLTTNDETFKKPSFDHGANVALTTAKWQAEFIAQNIGHLRKVDKSGKHELAAQSFARILSSGQTLTPAQYAYLENIYEMTFSGAGFDSFKGTKRGSLRAK